MTIREMKTEEYPLLDDFLYEAIYIPEGGELPPRAVIEEPELQVYVEGFGSGEDDKAVAAEIDGKVVGAAWARIMNDYGHVDDETPSFAISMYTEFRGQGIGKALMQKLLEILKDCGYEKVSLSVQKENYAVKMYKKTGFEVVEEKGEEYIMICQL